MSDRALVLLFLALAPLAFLKPPATRSRAVWLAVKNETGQALTDFVIDYGRGSFRYAVLSPGHTQGGYAAVEGEQPVTLTYKDASGAARSRRAPRPLQTAMAGSVARLYLRADEVRMELDRGARPDQPGSGLMPYWLRRLVLLALGVTMVGFLSALGGMVRIWRARRRDGTIMRR